MESTETEYEDAIHHGVCMFLLDLCNLRSSIEDHSAEDQN